MTLSCIVVDNDLFAVEQLEEYILEMPGLNMIISFTDPLVALIEIGALGKPIDILFTDVEMPGLSGLELASRLQHQVKNLVLVSSNIDYAIDGYHVNAKAFLSKPFNYKKFEAVVNRLISRIETEDPFIWVKLAKNSMVKVYIKNIIAIEGNGNYINIHTVNEILTPYYKISEIEKDLASYSQLKRVSKSFIVSIHYIKKRVGHSLSLQNNLLVNISEPYRKDFILNV